MERFNYKAKDSSGKIVTGKVEAAAKTDAARLLRDRNLTVITLSAENQLFQGIQKGLSAKVSFGNLTSFTRQFAIMVTSGIPITEGLLILRSQSENSLQPIIAQILADVEAGSSLGDAFAKHEKIFTPVYVALIRSGEEGGVLDKVLEKLASTMESQREFRSRVKGALIYPTVVIIGMGAVVTLMMVFVIPRLSQFYDEFDADLPAATQFLVNTSNFTINFWWLILLVLAGTIWGIRTLSRTPAGREKIDEWKLKLPIIGELQHQFMLTEMTRTLGLLVGAGVPILEALRVAADVVGNTIIRNAILGTAERVEKGFSMANSFSQYPEIFPPLFYQMIIVGEETGKMDESLLKVATVYEQEANQSIKNLMAAVEPLIMVVLGVGVGFLVIAIILPIYRLTSQF